ncbi:MAG: Amidase [Phenylobacterium sp.]|uniref:amidase family protein n=1 Tax=Phenylobacterium sp. TaxID=1871053 RepID=UPI00261F8054|nr:amidase family protein [Phenylobacterium sp.]MDB5496603.1 Amidase [Phenylobacterium sp.]
MDDLLKRDATDQLAALNARRVSAVELLKAALARHEQTHGQLNAVVAVNLERALERARAIDDLRMKGETLGLLAGLPMTVKDTLDVVGLPASSGLRSLRQRQAEDASVVKLARQAGAVIWGKTNTPVMAGDWQTFNALYGTTNNPWDQARTTGGSSGGAAAALATGVTALEIGSDIGGSLRIPASFCGVYSHKPTWGLVDQHGHVPPSPGSWSERDLNVVGPMARSARDLRLLLSVLEGGPLAPRAPPADLKEARIALWLDEPSFPLDPEVRAAIESFAAELSAAGAEVTPIASPVHMPSLMGAYQVLLGGVLGEDMPPGMIRGMERLRGWARWQMSRGAAPTSTAAMTLAYTATHREWMAADAVRARLRHEIAGVFSRFDAILSPIAPITAFPHDHRPFGRRRLTASDGKAMPYTSMLNWISLATALHLPATAIPAGPSSSGLPVGVQLIGPLNGDARMLALAQAIEENVRGFTAPELAS